MFTKKIKTIELNNFEVDSADQIKFAIKNLLKKRRSINICLSGGLTPLPILKLLKDKDLDFSRISFFLTDERNVNNNNLESNYFNLNKYFFKYISSKNYSIYEDLVSIDKAVSNYEKKIIDLVPAKKNIPSFDLIILGMGLDGHTASIFPETDALLENDKLVVKNYVEKLDSFRITLTYPIILNSYEIILLIKGTEKKNLLNNLNNHHPIKKIINESNNLTILCSAK
jgi:6-phosphogluconolactonase